MRRNSILKYKLTRVLIGGAFLASLTGCVVAPGYYGSTGTAYSSSYYVGSPYYYPYPGYYAPGYRTAIVVGGGYPGWRGNGGYPGGWHGGPNGQWHGGPSGWHGGPGNPGNWHGGPPNGGGMHGGPPGGGVAGMIGGHGGGGGGMGGGHGGGQH